MSRTTKDEQFDISKKFKKLFELKSKQRKETKEYYQKFLYNPHRPIKDGIPFDPNLQRYNAMSMYRVEYFKPTPKVFAQYAIFLLPFFLFHYFLKRSKSEQEELLRSGTVSYEDRKFKMYY